MKMKPDISLLNNETVHSVLFSTSYRLHKLEKYTPTPCFFLKLFIVKCSFATIKC